MELVNKAESNYSHSRTTRSPDEARNGMRRAYVWHWSCLRDDEIGHAGRITAGEHSPDNLTTYDVRQVSG